MTFAEACREVFVPLCREFATHELSLDALDESSRVKSILVLVGRNGERGELMLQDQKGKGPCLSFRVPVGSSPALNLWEVTLSRPSRFCFLSLSQRANLESHWVTVTSRAALCHRILGRALELVAGAEIALAKAEEEEETKIDNSVPREGFLGPDGHTIAFVM